MNNVGYNTTVEDVITLMTVLGLFFLGLVILIMIISWRQTRRGSKK